MKCFCDVCIESNVKSDVLYSRKYNDTFYNDSVEFNEDILCRCKKDFFSNINYSTFTKLARTVLFSAFFICILKLEKSSEVKV